MPEHLLDTADDVTLIVGELPSPDGVSCIPTDDGRYLLRFEAHHADPIADAVTRLAALRVAAFGRARAREHATAMGRLDALTAPILAAYPEAERASWSTRLIEARAVIDAPDPEAAIAGTVLLAAMAALPGMTPAGVVARAQSIVARATVFGLISVEVEAAREAIETALSGAETIESLAAAVTALEPVFDRVATVVAGARGSGA